MMADSHNKANNKENQNPKQDVVLRNGVCMPLVGLGTSHSGGYSHSSVVYALKNCGYRMVDTAKRYGTEEFINYAIKDSEVKRENIFLISKEWPTDYGYDSTKQALRGTLQRLGVDYIDLFLMHYPEVSSTCTDKWKTLGDTWRALECLYDDGLIRAIGVSNYSIDDIERQSQYGSMEPLVNQIEFHPYHYSQELVAYCQDNKIQVQGYCPLGMGNLVNDNHVVHIAKAVDKTPAQVLIRWSLQHNVSTVPKSTKKHRVKENIDVFDFELNADQMETLDTLDRSVKYQIVDTIQEKIDANQPDGYKLDQKLKEHLFES